jgi:hypothetical protein
MKKVITVLKIEEGIISETLRSPSPPPPKTLSYICREDRHFKWPPLP